MRVNAYRYGSFMEQNSGGPESAPTLPEITAILARRVKYLRDKRGWSAERLAEEMTRVGVPWKRVVVSKLESGRRQSVSLTEVLALAYVFNVGVVHLIVPTDGNDPFPVTPEQFVPPARAREWIRGRHPLPSFDPRIFFSEVPAQEWEPPEMTQEQMDRQARLNEIRRDLADQTGERPTMADPRPEGEAT